MAPLQDPVFQRVIRTISINGTRNKYKEDTNETYPQSVTKVMTEGSLYSRWQIYSKPRKRNKSKNEKIIENLNGIPGFR